MHVLDLNPFHTFQLVLMTDIDESDSLRSIRDIQEKANIIPCELFEIYKKVYIPHAKRNIQWGMLIKSTPKIVPDQNSSNHRPSNSFPVSRLYKKKTIKTKPQT